MLITGEVPQPPSSYEVTERSPALEWLTDEQYAFVRENFEKIRTEYNIIEEGEMKHRLCLISNLSESHFEKINRIFSRVLAYRRFHFNLGYSLVLLMEDNNTDVPKLEISEQWHCYSSDRVRDECTFQFFKSRFKFKFNRDSRNRFKDISSINLLRNMIDRYRPSFVDAMTALYRRPWYSNRKAIMPIALNIHVEGVRRGQRLPILVGSDGIRIITLRNYNDEGYTSN